MIEKETNSRKVNPIPLMENIKASSPITVELNDSFQKSKVEVPGIFDLKSIERFIFNRPAIPKLKTEFIPKQTSYSEVKKVLGKKRGKIKEQQPNEFAFFTKRLYQFKIKALNQLEKVFSNNPKMTRIINSIKKQYE